MNGIALLEQARKLKALGFPQPAFKDYPSRFPQLTWQRYAHEHYELFLQDGSAISSYDLAAPLFISGDTECPGVMEWVEGLRWRWWRQAPLGRAVECWFAIKDGPRSTLLASVSLSGLIDKLLDAMEAGSGHQGSKTTL